MALVALTLFVATMPPGLTYGHSGADGGDLISAARTLGIPHPPGYPTYTLLAWLFTQLPVGTLAYRTGLLSALSAAATVGLICSVAQAVLPSGRHTLLLAAATSLVLAFASLFWSQAIITEVYALLGLFAALELWLLIRWRLGGSDHLLWLAALLLGIGMGNHLTLIVLVPAAVVLLWSQRKRWLQWHVLVPMVILFAVGLAIYAYLPLAAARHPAVNWGNPVTWRRFLWMVTAKQYQAFAFGLDIEMIPGRLYDWSALIGDQFGWWGLVLALLGLWAWWHYDRAFAIFTLAWSLPVAGYAFLYNTGDSHVYLIPMVILASLWWAMGAKYLLERVHCLRPAWIWLAIAAILVLPFVSLALHWQSTDLSDDRTAQRYASEVIEELEKDSLVIVRGDRQTFTLWYALYAEKQRPDVAIVSGPMLAFIWYREHIRHLYPDLVVARPTGADITTDDLVAELVQENYSRRPIYATDPREEWKAWFRFEPKGDGPVFRVLPKPKWESDG